MILAGAAVALPAALVGLAFCNFLNRRMPLPMRDGSAPDPALEDESKLPPLFWSVLPVLLPVLLISLNTVLGTLAKAEAAQRLSPRAAGLVTAQASGPAATAAAAHDCLAALDTPLQTAARVAALLGNANFALFLSALVAMGVLMRQRGLTLAALAEVVEKALMSGGVIILITAAGGAFGAMLAAARIGPAIQGAFGQSGAGGLALLALGFAVAAVLKVAQGSSTVAMITASGMLAGMAASPEVLGYHPVYLALAIGSGSLVGSWMNDSGFWIVSKMSGFTEVETLKSWTILLVVLGCSGFVCSALLAMLVPFPTGAP
jgi:GntP family gluconate:H+ symporter